MGDLIFSLNATIPVFLLIAFGYLLKHLHVLDDYFIVALNRFTYNVTLPFMIYDNLAGIDIRTLWDSSYIFFCMIITLLSFVVSVLVSIYAVRSDYSLRGEFIQGSFRGSAVLLAFAYVKNLYGVVSVTSLMVLGSVPLYNLLSAIVLSLCCPKETAYKKSMVYDAIKNLIRNPVIVGVAIGLLGSIIGIKLPSSLNRTVSNVAALTAPLALICLGASFTLGAMKSRLKLTLLGASIKLLLLPAIFIPFAIYLGFSGENMAAVLVMLGSPTSVTSFVMAKNAGFDGILTASMVAFTTLISTFSITWWIYLLRTLDYL